MYFQSTFDSVLFLTAQDSNPDWTFDFSDYTLCVWLHTTLYPVASWFVSHINNIAVHVIVSVFVF
jgi:hypothetical protein